MFDSVHPGRPHVGARAALALLALSGCADDPAFSSARYADDAMWLCRPGKTDDACTGAALATTHIDAAGVRTDEPFVPAADPPLDCFYVYPTVDLGLEPMNHDDFSDLAPMKVALESQAARFATRCRVYAPLYRQVTIGTYFTNGSAPSVYQGENGALFELAYQDVREAFRHYLAQHADGRPLVLIGHSQGAGHLARLAQELFDDDPQLRRRLVVALLIGGTIEVPDGEVVGGTFQNLPLCTSADELGCVIAYRSYEASMPPTNGSNGAPSPGVDAACTNPAALGGGAGVLSAAYFPLSSTGAFEITATYPTPPVTTPFVAYPEFYGAECVRDANGRSYLAVGATSGPLESRSDPIGYGSFLLRPSFLGTHILDFHYAMGDLLRLVDAKAAAFGRR